MASVRSDRLPTTPAYAARLRIFQATRRPVMQLGGWVDTLWGQSRVTGALGQRHADLMDLLLHTYIRSHREDDGRIRLLIDPYLLRRGLSTGRTRLGACKSARNRRTPTPLYSAEQLDKLINDLSQAEIEYVLKSGLRKKDKIIEPREWATVTAPDPMHPGESRVLWRITLSPSWIQLLDELGVRYDPHPIVTMKHGVSQAAARLILSHDCKKWPSGILHIDTVLDWLGFPPKGCSRRDGRRWIQDDSQCYLLLGFRVTNGYFQVLEVS